MNLHTRRQHYRELDHAVTLAATLARDLDRAWVLDGAQEVDLACDLRRVVAALHARAGASDFDRATTRALRTALLVARGLTHDLDRATARARASARARHDAAADLSTRALIARCRAMTRDAERADALERARRHASSRALTLAHDLASVRDLARINSAEEHDGVIAARPAVRVSIAAAGLLPRRDRPRYAEEYLGELTGLATVGAGRWRQLGHALRLLARAGELRMTLAATARRRRRAAG